MLALQRCMFVWSDIPHARSTCTEYYVSSSKPVQEDLTTRPRTLTVGQLPAGNAIKLCLYCPKPIGTYHFMCAHCQNPGESQCELAAPPACCKILH